MNRQQWRERLAAWATTVNTAWRRTPDRIAETPMWVLADQTAAGEVARKKTKWF